MNNIESFVRKHKDWLIIAVIALIGLILIYRGLENQKKRIGLDAKVVEVLIAKRTLQEGEPFHPKDLRTELMPEKYVPTGALYPSDVPKFKSQVLSRTVNQGEILLSNALDIEFALDNASSKIHDGYRAITIPVDDVSSLAFSLEPGDHIDLMTSVENPQRGSTTMTLLQNVTVLSTGHLLGSYGESTYHTITLMVLPSEAPLIMHAMNHYDLSVVLRNPYDQETLQDLPMVTEKEIVEAGFLNHLQSQRDRHIRILQGQTP